MSATTIKRGDTATVAWTLEPAPPGPVTVIIRRLGATSPIVARAGTVTVDVVSIVLSALETARVGRYFVELESGGVTYPSAGYLELVIESDLNP